VDDLVRQITMLKRVPRGTWATTPQIHQALADEGFEVDIRTVQRDLMNIHERMLFPLEAELGSRPYKWRWPREGFVDIPSMTAAQALTFVMADRYLSEVFPPSLLEHLHPLVAHAEGVLGQMRNQQVGKWADKVAILPRQQALLSARVDAGIHDAIARALLTERQIEAVYQPRGRDAREYRLNPQALVMRGSASYLVASANEHDDPIHFALHRFVSADVSTRPARSIPGFSLARHIHEDKVFDYPMQDASIRLVALFDADRALHLHETPLSADQMLEAMPDERERLTATVKDTQELRWWLLGFGDGVEVLEPENLRAEFAAMASGLAMIYGARPPT